MAQKDSRQPVIRHRSLFTLPTKFSFWSLTLTTAVFFVLLLGYFLYTQSLVRELERDEDTLSEAVAQFMVNAFNMRTGLEDQEMVNIFVQYGNDTDILRELASEFDNPIAITDSSGAPVHWRSIGVPEDIATHDPEVLARVSDIIRKMDRQNPPMRILNIALEEQFVVHYGDPPALTRLRIIPLYLGAMLIGFVVIALWILRRQARTERSLIWAGMARESAHQLGTPISSLHGWLELLKIKLHEASVLRDSAVLETIDEVDGKEKEILDGIAQDIERLSKVANRFELIGRRSSYDRLDLTEVLRGTEQYFRARLPKRGKIIELQVELDDLPPVRGNPTLLEWAFENIIKNSIDALTGRGGTISIKAFYNAERNDVDILFSDNGPGISGNVRRHIFDTGVTTKNKGWGVGLALTRRIIEENHGGKIRLTQSSSDKGTVFLVALPSVGNPDKT
ncbi:PAS domain-containing sensor histidine kinase [Gemmatimonadota bacterium]